jgi:hypothetical protein
MTPPPPLKLSGRKDIDEQRLNNVAQENLTQINNGKGCFSSLSVRPINKNLNLNKKEQKNLKTGKTEDVRRYTNGVRRYTNGVRRYTNGVRRYTKDVRRYTKDARRYTKDARRYTEDARRYTESPQISAKSA